MLKAFMTAKQEVRTLLEKLPDNCSIEEIQYHLYVLEKVRTRLEDAREKGTISQEEVESRLSQWLSPFKKHCLQKKQAQGPSVLLAR